MYTQVAENVALGCTPASVAVWGEEEVAVGGEDHKVYVYSLLDPAQPKATLEGPRGQVRGVRRRLLIGFYFHSPAASVLYACASPYVELFIQVSALAYSPDGQYLAVGDSNREVSVFARGSGGGSGEWTALVQGQWVHHTSRITALAWSPSGQVGYLLLKGPGGREGRVGRGTYNPTALVYTVLIHSTLRAARWTPTSLPGASRTPRAAPPWTVRHAAAWSNRAHFKLNT